MKDGGWGRGVLGASEGDTESVKDPMGMSLLGQSLYNRLGPGGWMDGGHMDGGYETSMRAAEGQG